MSEGVLNFEVKFCSLNKVSLQNFNKIGMLKDKIKEDIKDAMKKREAERLSVLRMLDAAIKNKEIEKKKKEAGLSDEEILEVVSSEVKKRKDAAQQFKNGGRPELAEKEENEAATLIAYLPPQLSEGEIEALAKEAIEATGAKTEKEFGKVMGRLAPKIKGRADGALVSQIVRKYLRTA